MPDSSPSLTPSLRRRAPASDASDTILSPAAMAFVGELVRTFEPRVKRLLMRRQEAQARYDAGDRLGFLSLTSGIREGDWKVAPPPADLRRRCVEITGPVDRKMVVNALNSGADVFMADFEDSNAPSWENVIEGQLNLRDAVRRRIDFTHPVTRKRYTLCARPATLMVRPRGWHLVERHLTFRDQPVPAALVDFGLFMFHNAHALVAQGSGPYFYLPKLQGHREAELWNDVFVHAQRALSLPIGTIRATVLIETLPAAFEMDEILHALRDHSAGLNCGRWDYIFSTIKTLRRHADHVLPDRGQVGMTQPNMRAYTQLLVKTCHRRGAHAMGGMAAQIPIKNDPVAHQAAIAKVRADKEREAADGHDGTWVAHPGLVDVAREAFSKFMTGDNQWHVQRDDVRVEAADLLAIPQGTRTEAGLRQNVRVGIQYLEAWLRGSGCVPIENLMEDAATAEISRTQLWQWIRHGAATDDGQPITRARIEALADEELATLRDAVGAEHFDGGKFGEARALFLRVATDTTRFVEFLTLPAYEQLVGPLRVEAEALSA